MTELAVGRVRIRSDGDELRLRLGVDRLLGAADVHARRLPPAAILVVRRLADPLPRELDLRSALPSPRWERAVGAALDDLAATAARPADGPVPAAAESVLFTDRAELLACLALGWCAGELAAAWWWRALGMASAPALLRAWTEAPEAVPPAFARLAASGPAAGAAFAARVPPEAAAVMARRVGERFGAHALAEAALAPPRAAPPRGPAPPPWHAFAADAGGSLAVEQEVLLGLALLLARTPAVARAPAAAEAGRRWRAAREEPTTAAPPQGATTPAHRQPSGRPAGAPPPAHRPAGPEPRSGARHASSAPVPVPRPAAPPSHRRSSPGPAPPPDQAAPTVAPAPVLALQTALGGLFHLVFAAQEMGLYGDFSAPEEHGIELDVWDFVEVVGVRLLRRRPRDAVWRALEHLSAREPGIPAGSGADPEWLAELASRMRARLASALALPPGRAVALALRRPARIEITDTRVDVTSDLADLPIEVRMAGLDRDPGFIPAACRALYFHFQ